MHSIALFFPEEYRRKLQELWYERDLREIRIRAGKPLLYIVGQTEKVACFDGDPIVFWQEDIKKILYQICNYSVYAFEEERKQGFMTLQGGHRLGIAGKTVIDNGKIISFQTLSGLHIRVAHEIMGIADGILPFLYEKNRRVGTLIISPPGYGKTTLLSELTRNFSNGTVYGKGINLTVVDERSEIGGCFRGKPENDLGIRTDILDGCPKILGIMMAIRALTPDMIVLDEIGTNKEAEEIAKAVCCGVHFLLTAHGESVRDIQCRFPDSFFQMGKIKRMILLEKEEGRVRYKVWNVEEGRMVYE